MAKAIDLTGQKFGSITVIKRDYEIEKEHKNERQAWWICKCDLCGSEKSLRASVIKKSKTCGCKIGSHKGIIPKQAMKSARIKNKQNLIGKRFSRLLVIDEAEEDKQIYYNGFHKVTWKCLCDCGKIHYATTECLMRGDTPSCGCITKENGKNKLNDLSGKRYGHLLILKWVGTTNGNSKYLVRCDCGKEYEIYASNLTQGYTTSCGCVKESHGEEKIRDILIRNNIKFIPQKSFDNFHYSDTNGKPRYDFFLPERNILIEYDGEQHFKQMFRFDTEERFLLRKRHDEYKNIYAKENGYILIRIPYTHFENININDLLENSNFII